MRSFKLINKEKLTLDVFQIAFEISEEIKMLPWQFITFILAGIWWRSYSILKIEKNIVFLIIKRVENWKWWSKFICDLNIWDDIKWVWPAWKFVLQNNDNNKMFIWTGTWVVPLYNQIVNCFSVNKWAKIFLLFWLRYKRDLFFIEILEKWKKQNKNFDFEIYLSRDESEFYKKWYITEYITTENVLNYKEFYICWIPEMVDSVEEKLLENSIDSSFIYTEKY